MKRVFFQCAIISTAILFLAQPCMARAADTASQNANGASVFRANCVVCHGEDGGGNEVGKSLHAPDLRSNKVQQQSDAELTHFIGEGSGAMPAFKDSLDRQQILDEVHYIRSLGKHSEAHR